MRGAEALVRWHHPTLGTVSPAIFVPMAEPTNLIGLLGEWVMEEACRTAADWPLRLLSVNVSAVQLREPDFPDKVFAVLERTGFDPHRLKGEVTETSFIENATHRRPNLQALRSRGVKIRAILDLADASGLDVTAEGVETQAQSESLTSAGYDALQGYLLARPMPKDAVVAMFTASA